MDTTTERITLQTDHASVPSVSKRTTWSLQRTLSTLQWLAPALMILLVVVYELGPSRWIYANWGNSHHLLAEIIFFGTFGPSLLFALLLFSRRFLEERETSEVQAQIMTQHRERIQDLKLLGDHALQVMFAANLLLNTLSSNSSCLSKEEGLAIRETREALEIVSTELRSFLQE